MPLTKIYKVLREAFTNLTSLDEAHTLAVYIKMIGAEFRGHNSQCAVPALILDDKHPAMFPVAMAGLANKEGHIDLTKQTNPENGIWNVYDEMYIFKNVDRKNLHILLKLDKCFDDHSDESGKPGEFLISWAKAYGKGKVFYTSLGHRQEMWHDPIYQKHLTGGIRFALGLAKGSTKPTPE